MIPVVIIWKTYYASLIDPLTYTLYGGCALLINHLYGIVSNDKLNMKLILRQQAIATDKHDVEHMSVPGVVTTDSNSEYDNVTKKYVDQFVTKEINTWNLSDYETSHKRTYIVSNCYHHKLIFLFDDHDVAAEFLEEIQKLSTKEINVLNENAETAKLYQMRITNRIALKKLDGLN